MKRDSYGFTLPNQKKDELKRMLEAYAEKAVYPAKKIFLVPGDELRGIYYIVHGRTRHYVISMDGSEKILYTLTDGWFYGESSMILKEPTGLFSQAEEETTLYIIPYATYRMLLNSNEDFRMAVLENQARKTLMLRHEVENLSFNSCKERIKRLFYATADTAHLSDENWYELKMHYNQQEISSIIGGARITTNKLIRELCDEGFIRIVNRRIQLNVKAYQTEMKGRS